MCQYAGKVGVRVCIPILCFSTSPLSAAAKFEASCCSCSAASCENSKDANIKRHFEKLPSFTCRLVSSRKVPGRVKNCSYK